MSVSFACEIIESGKTAANVCNAENTAMDCVEEFCLGVYLVLMSAGLHVGGRKLGSAFSGPTMALTLSDSLLASSISLPQNTAVIYLRLSPSRGKPLEQIELVRQHLLALNASSTLLHSLLASVHIASPIPSIYIFAISSSDNPTDSSSKIQDLRFDYMTGTSLLA